MESLSAKRDGYIFRGWYLNGKLYDFSNKVTRNILLEAKWDKENEIYATSIELNKKTITLARGDSFTLKAKISPSNVDNKKLIWYSSNYNVAIVKNGVVMAINKGSAIITAKTSNGLTAKCNIIVNVPVSNIKIQVISKYKALYFGGPIVKLKAEILPLDEYNEEHVEWYSKSAFGKNATIYFTPSGNIIHIEPRKSGISENVKITAKYKNIEQDYLIYIENKFKIKKIKGDITKEAIINSEETVANDVNISKPNGIINITTSEKINDFRKSDKIEIISGINTISISIRVKNIIDDNFQYLYLITEAGQEVKINITKGY